MDAADSLGQLLQAEARQKRGWEQLIDLVSKLEQDEVQPVNDAQALVEGIESKPDAKILRLVEQGLHNLADYTMLGKSALAAELEVWGAPHIERGKAVRDELLGAIESLRPRGGRPSGTVPREWHAYIILHDAYVEDVPNRDITSQLYISETTFNRLRRKALTGVAQALLEAKHPPRLDRPETSTQPDPAGG